MTTTASEARRSRYEREQVALREAGIDPRAVKALGQPSADTGQETKLWRSSATSAKALQASRWRREQQAAAELGLQPPADCSDSFARTRTNTSQASIRRQRHRREQAAIAAIEKERRQREREEQQAERAADRAYAKARKAYLQKQRALEGMNGRYSVWRALLGSCWQPSPALRDEDNATPRDDDKVPKAEFA